MFQDEMPGRASADVADTLTWLHHVTQQFDNPRELPDTVHNLLVATRLLQRVLGNVAAGLDAHEHAAHGSAAAPADDGIENSQAASVLLRHAASVLDSVTGPLSDANTLTSRIAWYPRQTRPEATARESAVQSRPVRRRTSTPRQGRAL